MQQIKKNRPCQKSIPTIVAANDHTGKTLKRLLILLAAVILSLADSAVMSQTNIQPANQTAYYPTHQQILQRYIKQALMDSLTKNKVYNARVTAHWDQNNKGFWYVHQMPEGKIKYLHVSAKDGVCEPAFNQEKLAAVLQARIGKKVRADCLPIAHLKKSETKSQSWTFSVEGQYYQYNDQQGDLTTFINLPSKHVDRPWWRSAGFDFAPRPSRYDSFQTDTIAPDSSQSVMIVSGNLYVKDLTTGQQKQLTKDGSEKNPYGAIAWSADSKYFVAYHIFPVIDSNEYYVLSSVAGTTRGQLKSHPYKQPGDPFTAYQMHTFYPRQDKDILVKTDTIDYFPAPLIHWSASDPSSFMYERLDRGNQRFSIIKVQAQTGDTTIVYDEKTKTFIYESRLMTYYLPGDQLIYSSEKDGWQHLYLKDLKTGHETKITKGDWIVRNVDSVDSKKRVIWFSASGMNPGEDPYFLHYYRINFDGSNLVNLTPEQGNHSLDFSPDKTFYLDTYSEINQPPVTKLKRVIDGKQIATVEKADIKDLLATGVHLPTPFVAKGRDGKTDIYGIYCTPSSYDPHQKYPVIENIYAGPQDAFVPKSFLAYSEMQSIAELGFIVVQIDGMGTANRSKAFHDVCWQNLQDAGLPDRILWIKALAAKLPFVDDTRVGIYGTSAGGQDALDALLSHPEFYKAGVAACGCHDNRIDKQWWNEQWMGYPVSPQYAAASNVDNAYKLKGSLLLIVGEADTNVPPESTYRVADALIKAGKAFDFLPIPGSNHTDGGPYGRARKNDFFVRHLLKAEPPDHNGTSQFTLPKTGVR